MSLMNFNRALPPNILISIGRCPKEIVILKEKFIAIHCDCHLTDFYRFLFAAWYRSASGRRHGGDQALLYTDAASLLTTQ